MSLVVLTYQDEKDKNVARQEVVDSSSSRFTDLITRGVSAITVAQEGAVEGVVRSVHSLSYRTADGLKSVDINYTTHTGKVAIEGLSPFGIRGYSVGVIKDEHYGNLLSVDLENSVFTPIKKDEVNDINYVLKNVQEVNYALIDELMSGDFPEKEIDQSHGDHSDSQENDSTEKEGNDVIEN